MERRSISWNEINVSVVLMAIVSLALLIMKFVGLGLVLYFFSLLLFRKNIKRKKATKIKGIPGKSLLISQNEMEIHVNGTAKGDRDNFFTIVSESLVYGVENELRIIFYTWHLNEKSLRRRLGEDITVVTPGRFEKIAQVVFNPYYYKSYFRKKRNNKKINPLVKVIVDWDKISPEILSKLLILHSKEDAA